MSGFDVATPSSSHNYLDWRRNRASDDQSSLAKKRGLVNYYKLESESSHDSEDGSDSPRSIQGKETDLARDTSDLEWSSDESAASVIEFEVVSTDAELPEDKPQFVDSNSSSGTSDDEIIATTVIHAMLNDGDFMFADSEDSMSGTSTDSELSPFDYWNCAQCRNTNNNPMFRYCEKCYKVRKDFFPPRPKRKRPKCKRSKMQKHTSGSAQNEGEPSEVRVVENRKRSIENEGGDNTVKRVKRDICELSVIKKNLNNNIVLSDSYKAQSRIDIGITPIIDTLSFSQPAFTNFECNVEPLTKTLSDPAIMFSKDDIDLITHKHFTDNECDIVKADISLLDQPKRKFVNLTKQSESDMCITCLIEPKSGVFVHGRIAHICCCYKCSVKVWMKTKRCPICNCKGALHVVIDGMEFYITKEKLEAVSDTYNIAVCLSGTQHLNSLISNIIRHLVQ